MEGLGMGFSHKKGNGVSFSKAKGCLANSDNINKTLTASVGCQGQLTRGPGP